MSTTERLLTLIKENPNLPVVPMVYYKVVCDDGYSYWMGGFGDCDVAEYACFDEKFYTNRNEFMEDYYDKHNDEYEGMSEEEIDADIKEKTEGIWTKAIIVWIELPD